MTQFICGPFVTRWPQARTVSPLSQCAPNIYVKENAMNKPEPHTCTVRDGFFVVPCSTLASVVEATAFGKQKGITEWSYSDMKTHKPTRRFFGVRTKGRPDGMAFNFCPFCGTQIDAPFNPDSKEAQ